MRRVQVATEERLLLFSGDGRHAEVHAGLLQLGAAGLGDMLTLKQWCASSPVEFCSSIRALERSAIVRGRSAERQARLSMVTRGAAAAGRMLQGLAKAGGLSGVCGRFGINLGQLG